ncbi:MAG: ABC transporter permease [Oscillospiraceae bacterium]|nr:ABC transporter permease [Oscillospiraceae bacterium]
MSMQKNSLLKRITGNKSFTLVAVWIAVLVVFTIINKNYISPRNIKNMFNTAFNVGMLSIGISCLLISGVIDLSTGYTAMVGGIVVAIFLQANMPWLPALIIAVVLGSVVGLVNSFFVNCLNFPPFISTLAVGTAINGVGLLITKSQILPINNASFWELGSYSIFDVIPLPFLFTVILMVIYSLILQKTRIGRRVYIVGGNHQAARLAGINPKKITTVLFINNSCIACLVGALVSARMHMGSPSSNIGSDLDAITASVLGGVSFLGGAGGMFGAFVGVMLLTCFKNGLVLIGLGTFYQTIATGILLIAAMAIDHFRSTGRRTRAPAA